MRKTSFLVATVSLFLVTPVWAQQAPSNLGTVRLEARGAELKLKSGAATVAVAGDASALQPGIYTPVSLLLSRRMVTGDAGKKEESLWQLSSAGPWGTLARVSVVADQTTVLALGEPLTLKAGPKRSGDTVTFGFQIVGSAGEAYGSRVLKDGDPVTSPPKITILDESGKVLNTGSFQFG